MSDRDGKQLVKQESGSSSAQAVARQSGTASPSGQIVGLQQTAGNRAVSSLVAPQVKPEIRYQYTTPEGKTVTLTQEQYTSELERAKRSVGADLNSIEGLADYWRNAQQQTLSEYQGGVESLWDVAKKPNALFGIAADIKAGVTPPPISIWTPPKNFARAGLEELQKGNLRQAAGYLQTAEAELRDAKKKWSDYQAATIGGAEAVASNLATVRDVSFAIAIAAAVVVAAPAVAAGASSLVGAAGLTGTVATATGTVLTEGTLVAGGGALGAGLRTASSAAGQKLAYGTVKGSELKKEGAEGFIHGMQSASLVRGATAQVISTVGSAGVQAIMGEKVDWTKVTVDALVAIMLQKFGGKLATGITNKIIAENPATQGLGRNLLRQVTLGVLMHVEMSTVFSAVDEVYRTFRGQDLSLDRFSDELVKRLTDPSILLLLLMPRIMNQAHASAGKGQRATGTPPARSSQVSPVKSPPLEDVRTSPVIAGAKPANDVAAVTAAIPSTNENPLAKTQAPPSRPDRVEAGQSGRTRPQPVTDPPAIATAVRGGSPDVSGQYRFRQFTRRNRTYKQVQGRLGMPREVETHRDPRAQRRVAGGTGDDAGHLIGDRFGAPGGPENLNPQNWKANRFGTYKQLENDWARKRQLGIEIDVTVTDVTRSGENRPFLRRVTWTETAPNGTRSSFDLDFANTTTPESRGKRGIAPTHSSEQTDNVIHVDFAGRRRTENP